VVVRIDFDVSHWAAWAPGLITPEAWLGWAKSATVPQGKDTPPLTEVPAMARRRVEKMGRLAFQVATWCQAAGSAPDAPPRGVPMIFASRHGDVTRSYDLLAMLARNESLSPTSFALSVHNAIGAQYSIIRGDRATLSAVSNGRFTLEAAVLEAAALLTEHPEVLVVSYESMLPDNYAAFVDEPQSDFAFAWRLTKGTRFALEQTPVDAGLELQLPHSLDVLRFLLDAERQAIVRADGAAGWRWSRA
jgi:hypothetical protein